MVYYVRKNIKLFDDKTFYDYKLCANFVDSQNQVLLDHQRHFRSKFEKIRRLVFEMMLRSRSLIGQYLHGLDLIGRTRDQMSINLKTILNNEIL